MSVNHPQPLLSRRDFLRIGGAAALLAFSGCEDDKPKSEPPKEQKENKEQAKVILPTFDFKDETLKTIVPDGLEISPGEFVTISQNIGVATRALFQNMAFDKATEQSAKAQIVIEIFTHIDDIIKKSDPRIAEIFERKISEIGQDPFKLGAYLNQYLISGGYYLAVNVGRVQDNIIDIGLYPVEKTSSVAMDDKIFQAEIPILHLGEAIGYSSVDPFAQDAIAMVDHDFHYVLFSVPNAESKAEQLLSRLPQQYLRFRLSNDTSKEKVKAGFKKDMLRHEATHVFLAGKFPKVGKITAKKYYKVQLVVPLRNERKADMSGQYAIVMFQELCGIGMQLAGTENEVPLTQYEKFIAGGKVSDTYLFAQSMLVTLTLGTEPETELSNSILEKFRGANPQLKVDDLLELIGTPPYNITHTQKVGAMMYMYGHQLLESMEKQF